MKTSMRHDANQFNRVPPDPRISWSPRGMRPGNFTLGCHSAHRFGKYSSRRIVMTGDCDAASTDETLSRLSRARAGDPRLRRALWAAWCGLTSGRRLGRDPQSAALRSRSVGGRDFQSDPESRRGTRSENPFCAGVSASASCEGRASNRRDPLNSRSLDTQAGSPSARRQFLRRTTLPPPDGGPIPRNGDGARKAG